MARSAVVLRCDGARFAVFWREAEGTIKGYTSRGTYVSYNRTDRDPRPLRRTPLRSKRVLRSRGVMLESWNKPLEVSGIVGRRVTLGIEATTVWSA